MKKILATAAALLALAAPAIADPLEGLWRTIADDNGNSGLVQVSPCGSQLCGVLVRGYDASGNEVKSDNIGRMIISETVPVGGGQYQGKIYAPDRGKTYSSRLTLSGNQLRVEGCVLGICRDGGTWQRVN